MVKKYTIFGHNYSSFLFITWAKITGILLAQILCLNYMLTNCS